MNIDESNTLIAKFMDFHFYDENRILGINYKSVNVRSQIPIYLTNWSEMQFHSSWDWLMPVVEKIENLHYKTIIGGGDGWGHYCNIMFGEPFEKALGKGETKLEAIFYAVVEFINWYNVKHN